MVTKIERADLMGVNDMDSVTAQRFLNILESIFDRLGTIEKQLVDVARLQERVGSQEDAIRRYGSRLDGHSERIRSVELWRANYGDKSEIDTLITHLKNDISTLKEHRTIMESTRDDVMKLKDKIDVLDRLLEKTEYQRGVVKELTDKTALIEKTLDTNKGQKDIVKESLKWLSGLLAAVLAYKMNGG